MAGLLCKKHAYLLRASVIFACLCNSDDACRRQILSHVSHVTNGAEAGAGIALGFVPSAGANRCAEQGRVEALLVCPATLLQAALHLHEGMLASLSPSS